MGEPRRRGKWIRRLVRLCIGLVLAALLCEGLVLVIYGEQVKFPRHVVEAEWGLRYNEPDASYRHKSADGTWYFRINGQGMRADRDYEYAKPPGVKRVVSLGDSFTVGYEVHEPECFSRVLERELESAGLKVEVLNCGVSGFSNAEAALSLERELHKYEPDLILLSFFTNDLVDNVRTDLFALEDEELVTKQWRYVPMGGLGNFLNTSGFFNFLSERSNAFAFAKETVTKMLKQAAVNENTENIDRAVGEAESGPEQSADGRADYERRLAASILGRMYEWAHERGIPFMIQSIPAREYNPGICLVDLFPREEFDLERPGLHFVKMKAHLDPHLGGVQLYNDRSHCHWTASAHEISGKALSQLVLREQLLAGAVEGRAPNR